MLKKGYKEVKNQDIFGHSVLLNFNKNGNTHNTFCGGIFSILIRLLMVYYLYTLLGNMIGYKKDTVGTILKDKDKAE